MHSRVYRLVLAFGAILLVSHFGVAAAPAPDRRAAQLDALYGGCNTKPSPGLAVAIVRDGQVILRKGYGLASIEHGVPITPSTERTSRRRSKNPVSIRIVVKNGSLRCSTRAWATFR
jgi:hypothetical protein